jgi:hypothetical protein
MIATAPADGPRRVQRGNSLGEVGDVAVAGRILENRAENGFRVQLADVILDDLDP